LIKKLWNIVWDMLEHWNEALHNSTTNHDLILEKDLNDKIKQICMSGPGQLAQADIHLMKHSLEHELQLPLLTKQWLNSIAAAVHHKQLHEHGNMIAEQRLIAMWVVRNPPQQELAPVTQQRRPTTPIR